MHDRMSPQVQIVLRQRGYYANAIDGFMELYTQEAIQRFQVDHCQRTAPLITRQLLTPLGIERDGKSVLDPGDETMGCSEISAILTERIDKRRKMAGHFGDNPRQRNGPAS